MKPTFTSLLYVFFAALLFVAPQSALAADDDDSDAKDGDADGSDEGDAEQEYVEPDAWERPPAEEEKPKEVKKRKMEEPPPGDGRHFQAGLTLGWGFPVEKRKIFADDAWNFGVGLRAGYTFEYNVWGGLMYSYFLGSGSTQGQLVAAEAGYDWWMTDSVIVRPSVDLGAAIIDGPDVSGTSTSTVRGGFYFGPGLVVIVPLGLMYTGGEIRHAVVTNALQSTTMLSAYVGVRL